MKVYACPDEVPAPVADYCNYDLKKEVAKEEKHKTALKKWLIDAGYTGSYTGEIYSTPMADGYAQYMIGDKGKSGVLIHLPYGDAWDSRDVAHLPKSEIINRIESKKKFTPLFGKKN